MNIQHHPRKCFIQWLKRSSTGLWFSLTIPVLVIPNHRGLLFLSTFWTHTGLGKTVVPSSTFAFRACLTHPQESTSLLPRADHEDPAGISASGEGDAGSSTARSSGTLAPLCEAELTPLFYGTASGQGPKHQPPPIRPARGQETRTPVERAAAAVLALPESHVD